MQGSLRVTRLGTVVLGTWHGDPIDRAYLSGLLYTDISGLATVAHTGAYSDLSGTPAAVTPAALTKSDDTNVTLSLGGTPATALLQAASISVGWAGTLAVARGGSGAATLTGYVKGNGTSAFTASASIPYADLSGAPSLATVATSGLFADLLSKPTTLSGYGITDAQGLDATLTALAGLDSTAGLVVETAADTFTKRTLTGTSNRVSISNGSGAAGNPTVDIDAAYVGQTSITTLGTIATGVWSGTAIGATKGGTGLTSYAQGDLLYASATDTPAKLAKDTNATRYLSNTGSSNNPAWAQIALATGVSGDLPFANLTQIAGLSVLGVTGSATADVAAITASADGQILTRVSSSSVVFSDRTANPSASAGLSAVNGSATTFMRSDGAPAIDQTIAPTWSGLHTFNARVVIGQPASSSIALSITGYDGSISCLNLTNGDLTMPTFMRWGRNGTTFDAYAGVAGAANNILTGSAQGDFCLRNDSGFLLFGANGSTIRAKLSNTTFTFWESGFNVGAAGMLTGATQETGTFTGTLTGCTTSPTLAIRYSRVGSMVTINFPSALTATSNATTMTVTGLPAGLQPAHTQRSSCIVTDNALSQQGYCQATAGSGTLTFGVLLAFATGLSSSGFTNSGTKGVVSACSFTYSLD